MFTYHSLYTQNINHEMVHALLQKFTPTLVDEYGKNIIIRSKDPFEHLEMLKTYSDQSFVNDEPPFRAWSSQK